MEKSLYLPGLDRFYFDRVWIKAYPGFFANLHDSYNYQDYVSYRDSGIFRSMSNSAFRLYRTLRLVKVGLKKGIPVSEIPRHVDELARYGEKDFYEFHEGDDGRVVVDVDDRHYVFSVDVVKTVRFISYTTVVNDRVSYEKMIFLEYWPYLRLMVKPYLSGFAPPVIRLLYNPLIRARLKLGVSDDNYGYTHNNFVDPDGIDLDRFVALNHEYAFDKNMVKLARQFWRMWFNRDDNLRVRVSQVELSYDSKIPKIRLANAFHFLGGRAKTIKNSVDGNGKYYLDDGGLKYYITIRKGLQLKTYTKAWLFSGDGKSVSRVLNRIEFTFSVDRDLQDVDASSVIRRGDLVEAYMSLRKALLDDSGAARIRELIKPFIDCRSECELHYAFWLDLLMSGQVKGSGLYRHVSEVYKRKGLLRVFGRGRNSVYVLNPSLLPFAEKLREAVGVAFTELAIPHIDDDVDGGND